MMAATAAAATIFRQLNSLIGRLPRAHASDSLSLRSRVR